MPSTFPPASPPTANNLEAVGSAKAKGQRGDKRRLVLLFFVIFVWTVLGTYMTVQFLTCALRRWQRGRALQVWQSTASFTTHSKFYHYTRLRTWQSGLILNQFQSMPHTHNCWRETTSWWSEVCKFLLVVFWGQCSFDWKIYQLTCSKQYLIKLLVRSKVVNICQMNLVIIQI